MCDDILHLISLSPSLLSPSVTGEAYDLAVANLMGMGFEREQVVRALHASFNNPERAAEYLFSVSYQLGVVKPLVTYVLCKIELLNIS